MALDIRLDFINKIDENYLKKMTEIREAYIKIDELLQSLFNEAENRIIPAAARTISMARTSNEQACQQTIKGLCILGELK
jgi:hypothetical protein